MQRLAVVLFLEIVAVVGLSSAKLINGARAAVDKPIQWLFNGPGVAAMAASAEASRILQSRRPFVMWGRSLTNVPPDWGAVPVISFKSFGAIKDALEMGTLGSEIKGVMYDYETWGFTPVEEQKDPAGYVKQAAKLVHARGLLFLTAPAVNLAEVMKPNSSPAQRDQTYLRLGIAADAARYADVFDIQAQRFESDTQHYANFVQQAAMQARQANPNVLVLAGISTQPIGQQVTVNAGPLPRRAMLLMAIGSTFQSHQSILHALPRSVQISP